MNSKSMATKWFILIEPCFVLIGRQTCLLRCVRNIEQTSIVQSTLKHVVCELVRRTSAHMNLDSTKRFQKPRHYYKFRGCFLSSISRIPVRLQDPNTSVLDLTDQEQRNTITSNYSTEFVFHCHFNVTGTRNRTRSYQGIAINNWVIGRHCLVNLIRFVMI